MKYIYLMLALIISYNSYSQDLLDPVDDNDIEGLIERLSWDSFGIFYNNFSTKIEIDYYSEAILKIGKETSPKLVEALKIDSKSVVAHIILTRLWEEDLYFLKEQISKPFEDLPPITEYTFNSLSWYVTNSEMNIDPYHKDIIYQYWTKRINECN